MPGLLYSNPTLPMTAHQLLIGHKFPRDMIITTVGCTPNRVKFVLVTIQEGRAGGWIQEC